MERNTYLLSTMRVCNTGIMKMIGKMKLRNNLSFNAKKYMRSKGLGQ